MGPLLAAYVVLPVGHAWVDGFSALVLNGMILLWWIGSWAKQQHLRARSRTRKPDAASALPRITVLFAIAVLAMLIFSKYVYLASLSSYYTFYLIEVFGVSIQGSQILLFVFLGAVAAGAQIGRA